MILDHEDALKPWLVKTLEPICDAEPGALADYILALLKHDAPTENDLRKEMELQLDEFLEKECRTFLDTLFTALRTKSYIPYTTTSSPKSRDTGIPIPVEGLLSSTHSSSPARSRKRSLEGDEGRALSKTPRLDTDTQFSRYGNGRAGESRSGVSWNARENGYRDSSFVGNNMGYANGRRQSNYQPPDQRRGICRDYHNNGFCARGAQCKYRHGDDALVPAQLFPAGISNGMMSVLPMLSAPFGMAGPAAYDPHDSQMDLRRNLPPALLPHGNGFSIHTSGELPVIQDLTPEVPHSAVTPHPSSQTQRPPPSQHTHPHQFHNDSPHNNFAIDVEMNGSTDQNLQNRPSTSNYRKPRSGPGTFNNDAPNFRPERRKDKTLVMEKIPEDKLSLEHVNDWFKRFGTVTNVAIDRAAAKALISFSTHEEAYAAWKSEDAVFNNRFVKLFWHRPMEGHGQLGSRMLAASAPAVAQLSKEPPAVPPPSTPSVSVTSSRKSASNDVSVLAAKQQLLEQQITEQKSLMASLDSATPDEKKDIMSKLRKLTEDMKNPISASQPKSMPMDRDRKEKLDKELDLHNAAGVVESEDDNPEALKAKLERLKAEAASLGISDDPDAPSTQYRPYRGRPRGFRGYARGMLRGSPGRTSMKLDNRPKKLLVKGVNAEKLQALQDWYETTGQVESLTQTENGDVVVSFKTRAAAEQGFTKGHEVPTVGSVQVSWFTGIQPASSSRISQSAKTSSGSAAPELPMRELSPEAEQPTLHDEEEVIATGWGDSEDGMGML